MPALDINTPLGQLTLSDEAKAVAIFEARYRRYKYIDTDKATMAKADALLLCDGKLAGLVLTSCRYRCSLLTFQMSWNWEWLVTWRKLAIGALLCKHLQTRLYGFIYIVDDDLLLIQPLFDPLKLPTQRWLTPMRFAHTETQATCNGGSIVRRNAFIKIDHATQVRRQ